MALNYSDKEKHFLPSFLDKIKRLINKNNEELWTTLLNQEKYDNVKKMMEEKNIDEHSLQWAEMFIKNWLALYVVSTIKNFKCDHNDVVDLLIVNNQSDLLLWENNSMVEDFKVDTNGTLEKLYYTNKWNSFRGVSISESRWNENRTPKFLIALDKFKDNTMLRKYIIDDLKSKSDEYLWFAFRGNMIDKFVDLLTPEEQDENKDFIEKITKIIESYKQ